MISTREIKNVKALSSKKFRDASGLFTVEGEKLVAEALESDFEVLQVWRRDEIGEEAMSRISALSTPSPVLAVLRQRGSHHVSKLRGCRSQTLIRLFKAFSGIQNIHCRHGRQMLRIR